MKNKKLLISKLQEEFNQWELFLEGLSENQIKSAFSDSTWTIKDVVAHLMAWQQISNARLEAALLNSDPKFPQWLAGWDPDSDKDLEKINGWIYLNYKDQPWENVNQMWRTGFQKLLKTTEMISEKDLLEAGRFAWLGEHPLSVVLDGTYDHHYEHHIQI